VLGDLTTNHVGDGHPWFVAARNGSPGAERGFFVFDDELEHGYESWYGVPSLPKLDYRSPELRDRMYANGDSVVRRWLAGPYALDGWRVDVANMTGRLGDVNLTTEVAAGVRAAAVATRSDALVVAEHAHDARGDLRPGSWHGTMAYSGFTRPVWAWLRGDTVPGELATSFLGLPVGVPRLPGPAIVETMRRFRAGVAWASVLHSWSILDSHDTGRFRTVAGSRERQLVGVGLQMTSPGVPMVYAGDELGLEGEWGEDARRTMPWSQRETWDGELLDAYRELIAVRRSSSALARGGIRYVQLADDALCYAREAPGETVLCLAARGPHTPIAVELARLGGARLEALYGERVEARNGVAALPAGGPAFHAWRVVS
jgi:alpha-glucosidase